MDALPDDEAFLGPFREFFDPRIGRPSTPMEVYLRLTFPSQVPAGRRDTMPGGRGLVHLATVCRIPFVGAVPHPTTPMRLTTRCGSMAVDGVEPGARSRSSGRGRHGAGRRTAGRAGRIRRRRWSLVADAIAVRRSAARHAPPHIRWSGRLAGALHPSRLGLPTDGVNRSTASRSSSNVVDGGFGRVVATRWLWVGLELVAVSGSWCGSGRVRGCRFLVTRSARRRRARGRCRRAHCGRLA